jgi:hypothetical protein
VALVHGIHVSCSSLVRSPADGPPSTLSATILPGAQRRRWRPSSAPAGRPTTLEAQVPRGQLRLVRALDLRSIARSSRRLHPPVPSPPARSPPSPRPVQEPRSAAASPPASGECGAGGEGGSAGGGSRGGGEGGSAGGWSRGAGGGEEAACCRRPAGRRTRTSTEVSPRL